MPDKFKVGNLLTQNNTLGTDSSSVQVLTANYCAIVCLSPVIPENTRVTLGPSDTLEKVYPFQLIQRNFGNKFTVTIPATIQSTDVTINKNLEIDWVLFTPEETPFIPTFLPKAGNLTFTIDNSNNNRSMDNLKFSELDISMRATADDNTAYGIRLYNANGRDIRDYYLQAFDFSEDNVPNNSAHVQGLRNTHRIDFFRTGGTEAEFSLDFRT